MTNPYDELFDAQFERIVAPALSELGFTRVKLQKCMSPVYLYKKNDLWFSLSWDWRDRYLDVALGHLHWFKDVMPRVVVVGKYGSYNSKIHWDSLNNQREEDVLNEISVSLSKAIETYKTHYKEIFDSLSTHNADIYSKHLGEEVKHKELENFLVKGTGCKPWREIATFLTKIWKPLKRA